MKRRVFFRMIGMVLCLLCYLPGHGQWSVIKTFSCEMYDICFLSRDIGYICGGSNDGVLMMTEDGGDTWTTVITSATDIFRAVDYLTIDIGCITTTGLGDRIFRTDDAGATWIEVYVAGAPMYDINFLNNSTAYTAPSSLNSHSLVKSENAGVAWFEVGSFTTIQSGDGVMDIQFPDMDTGYLALDAGYIYKTTTGGVSWDEKYSTNTYSIRALQFFSTDTGYAVGEHTNCAGTQCGILLCTQDGGEMWDTLFFEEEIYEIEFIDQDTGYIGSYGILRTTDGGLTWIPESGTSYGEVTKIDFPDPEVGYALARLPDQAWLLKRDPVMDVQEIDQHNIPTLTIFPNPASDIITLSYCSQNGSTVCFEFLDVTGRSVFSLKNRMISHGCFQESISVASLRPGIYMVRATCENQVVTKRVFIF